MGKLLTVTSGEFQRKTGIHFCTDHNGKMKGLWSLSTSPHNELCEKHSKLKHSICEHCYSLAMQKQYKDLDKVLENNTKILTSHMLTEEELPKVGNALNMCRYESFGDCTTPIQVTNYFHITEANPEIHFALWTKNPWIIAKAMKEYGMQKPDNLVIIGSSYLINKPMTEFYRKYDFIDYIFTVYDKEYIDEHHVDINCGGRSCRNCRRCYTKTHDGYEIREKLK